MKKIFIVFSILISTSVFGQGNYILEWQTPSGMNFKGIYSFEKNNNVFEISAFDLNSNSLKIYDGNTHIVKYTIQYNHDSDDIFMPNGLYLINRSLEVGTDFNNDGIYDYVVKSSNSTNTILNIFNSFNNSLITQLNFTSVGFQQFGLLDIDGDGFIELLVQQEISPSLWTLYVYSTPAQSVSVNENNTTIPSYKLNQNYPNPFNPSTTIEYSINKTSDVKIKIYDITGREMQLLAQGIQTSGTYKVNLTAKSLSSGTYFYQLIIDGYSESKKMVVIK